MISAWYLHKAWQEAEFKYGEVKTGETVRDDFGGFEVIGLKIGCTPNANIEGSVRDAIPVGVSNSSNRASYDVKRLAKALTDNSFNFKYPAAEKATGSWDESNKLGQGGFGDVYKVGGRNIVLDWCRCYSFEGSRGFPPLDCWHKT
ncbi:gnk2-like domain-containing protein [Artemisia annua]|uniref:Gnk2-like domain-containing protein n=1 Tax=Artemisia annua TaxID=35608 RepID=A0A2U1LQN4_ARTAN|nr:gnk2-like domain-containing protein [Artemisia annua]